MSISEEWMVLPGFSRYFISNMGTIKRIKKSKRGNGQAFKEIILKTREINGYLASTLIRDDGLKKTVYIHRAIANCFIPKDPSKSKLFVIHKDGNKQNNRLDNLSWKSFSAFMKREFDTGRRSNKDLWAKRVNKYGPKGSPNPSGKRSINISLENRQKIYALYHNQHYTLKDLSLQYNCSISHIYNLLQRFKEEVKR